MTAEEQKKQKEAERAANKAHFTRLAKFHESQATRYRKQADDCDEVTLVSQEPSGAFAGL